MGLVQRPHRAGGDGRIAIIQLDLPPVGPIQFEDLSKLVGQWVKLKTYNGRTWQGQVKAVKGNEVQLTVTQRSGAALMTLKKNAIASLERI